MSVVMFLLLFSLLMSQTSAQWDWMYSEDEKTENPVQVFDFDVYKNPNDTAVVSMTYNETLSVPFTLCFWLFPYYYKAHGIVVTIDDEDIFFQVSILGGRLEVKLDGNCRVPISDEILEAYHWYHVCITLNHRFIHCQLDGSNHDTALGILSFCKNHTSSEDIPLITLSNDRVGFEFSGMIGDLQLFSRELASSEVNVLSQCQDRPRDLMELVYLEMIGVTVLEKEGRHLCDPPPSEFLALFPESLGQEGSREFCQKMGSRLINMSDDLEVITRQISTNKDVYNTEYLTFWTDDSMGEQGYVLNVNHGESSQRAKFSSSAMFETVGCMIPFGNTLYYKNEDKTSSAHAFPSKGKLIFLLEDDYIVYRDYYCLDSNDVNDDFSSYLVLSVKGFIIFCSKVEMGQHLFGRRLWKCPTSGNEVNVTFSHCDESEYTCTYGQCISLDKKCDGQPDCTDGSDEGELCYLIDNLSGFLRDMCPEPDPKVDMKISIDEVQDISLEKNTMSVVLHVSTMWRDRRVHFSNLHNETTSLYREESKNLWYPKLKFENAHYKDNLILSTESDSAYVLVYDVTPLTEGKNEVRNSYEIRIHEGSDVEITRSIRYLFTFHCVYNFTLYPFDTQECLMKILLVKCPGCSPRLDLENKANSVETRFTKLSMYEISRAHYCYTTTSEGEDMIILHLLLARNFGSQLLLTFIPCCILCFLSMLTLTHFQISDFTDRITVTLSLLIVLASIFAQVSSSLPESPHPKLVDIFFSYCIMRVSFVFFIHCCIERMIRFGTQKSLEEVTNVDPITDIYHKIAWLSDELEKREEEEKKKSKVNWPRIINGIGIALTIVSDICIIAVYSVIVIRERTEKSQRMNSLYSIEESLEY